MTRKPKPRRDRHQAEPQHEPFMSGADASSEDPGPRNELAEIRETTTLTPPTLTDIRQRAANQRAELARTIAEQHAETARVISELEAWRGELDRTIAYLRGDKSSGR